MPFNGSGTFTRNQDWSADRDAGSPDNIIDADKMDDEDDNFKGGFDQCITRNGESTISANLPMNAKKHTSVAIASESLPASSRGGSPSGRIPTDSGLC